jgi:tetratricopeptide (TPR) repeat protein
MTAYAPGALVLAGMLVFPAAASARQGADALRARGLELSFNLDHAEALAVFRESITADPDNLAGYRLMAAALWADALFRHGAVSAEDFTGETRTPFRSRQSTVDLENAANELRRRADALAATRRRDRSAADAEAAYQIGAAYRLLSALAGSIGGSQWRTLGAARRAYQEHQRVLAIDPRHQDASLTVGLFRYFVSNMPVWSRLVARVAGISSDRDSGLRLVEQAASSEGPARANALFSLIVIYNQQARHEDALKAIERLQRLFPRNRLLWLEAASTQLRAGRPADARLSIEHGLRMVEADTRLLAFGELARWRCHYGISLARLNQVDAARQQFTAALQGEGLDWVRERARLELGKLPSRRQ